MLSDPIINWKDVLKGKGLSKADLAAMPVGSSGLTKKELRQTLNGLSGSQAQLASLLPPAAFEDFTVCTRVYSRGLVRNPEKTLIFCFAEVLSSYF